VCSSDLTRYDAKATLSSYQKVKTPNNTKVIYIWGSPTCLPLVPIAEKEQRFNSNQEQDPLQIISGSKENNSNEEERKFKSDSESANLIKMRDVLVPSMEILKAI
jgi:hypothetical protein